MLLRTLALLGFTLTLVSFQASHAQAQSASVDQNVLRHAVNIAKLCPQNWESDTCLKAVSLSNKDMAVKYAGALEASGKKDSIEQLKQVCAAATVTEEDVGEEIPAYAFLSAYTECANGIYDISEQTGVKPNQQHYQLIVGSVLCLNKAPQCTVLERQMESYKKM